MNTFDFGESFKRLLKFLLPIGIGYTLEMSVYTINYLFVGHYCPAAEIGAISIANVIVLMVFYYPNIGVQIELNKVLSAKHSQKDTNGFLRYFNSAILVISSMDTVSSLILFFCAPLLTAIGIDPEVS